MTDDEATELADLSPGNDTIKVSYIERYGHKTLEITAFYAGIASGHDGDYLLLYSLEDAHKAQIAIGLTKVRSVKKLRRMDPWVEIALPEKRSDA